MELNNIQLGEAMGKLKESTSKLEDFMDNASDLIQMVSPEGRLLYVNRAWRMALGLSEQETLNLPAEKIVAPAHRELWRQTMSQAFSGQTIHDLQIDLVGRQGRPFTVEGSVNCRFVKKRPTYMRCLFRDITERRKIEVMRNEVIEIVTHELRNPLFAISGSLQVILGGLAGEVGPKATKMAEIAGNGCKSMLKLINDYLDVKKIEAGLLEVTLEPVKLRSMAAEALEIARVPADKAGVALVLSEDLPELALSTDRVRLGQVVINLVSNAVKFSPRGGTVTVSLSLDGQVVRLSVADRGPGIPEDFRDRIFQRFAQSAGTAREKGGSGLGLRISKSIVELLGGTIGYTTKLGEGTTFFVDLPLPAADQKA